MTTPRAILAITAGTSAGYIIAICWAGLATPRGIGVAVAIIAACVIGFYLVKAIEEDGQRERDKAPLRPGTIIFDHKPRDRSGIECGRCGGSTFFSHKCVDGAMVPGALDGLAP